MIPCDMALDRRCQVIYGMLVSVVLRHYILVLGKYNNNMQKELEVSRQRKARNILLYFTSVVHIFEFVQLCPESWHSVDPFSG